MYWAPQSYSNYLYSFIPYQNVPANEYHRTLTVTPSLTGVWRGDDGGTYYIHQPTVGINSPIFWLGLSSDGGRSFSNVFSGNLQSGGIVVGKWGDVPLGRGLGHGTLRLHIDINRKSFRAINKTGGFSGSVWTKQR